MSYKAMYITEDGKLVYYLPSGTLKGYKVWNLNEVGYISTTGANKGVFSICDSNMQVLAGEYVTPSKKNVKEKSYKSFDAGVGNSVAEYAEFLKKEAGIQYLSNGTVVE